MTSNTDIRGITILGATGSIGTSTLDLIESARDRFRVEALTANRDVTKLAHLARKFSAKLAVIADPALHEQLKSLLSGTGIETASGPEGLVEAANRPAELVMASIVGAAGLPPVVAAVRRGAAIAFANKECLVSAGEFMMREVVAHKATLLPVDSEHNAIFQVFDNSAREHILRLILTASGGPFRSWSLEQMAHATPEQAVAHPNWSMGAKISVDSATMMNKGLEVIEARYLFDMPEPQLDVVVHPQSVIHSLVEYADGSMLAQLGAPDMRTPIAHAIAWPQRMATTGQRLDLANAGPLTFEKADPVRFPALRLAREALKAGGSAPAMMSAANEVAVAAFLDRRIGFLDIASVVEQVLSDLPHHSLGSLDDVYAADADARARASELIAVRPGFAAAG
jgi:1-deoxy-D-xylulose-5-phosphate reductoisomerase